MNVIEQHGYRRKQVDLFEVPGAFEIPLHAKVLAKSRRYARHRRGRLRRRWRDLPHEFVAASVIDALMLVQLETEIPVISLVLTPQRFHEHDEHRSFFREHFLVKGAEAAQACAATVAGLRTIRA